LDDLPRIDLNFVSFDYLRGIAMKHPFEPRDAELGYVDVIDALRNWTLFFVVVGVWLVRTPPPEKLL